MAVDGVDLAIERIKSYKRAGADLLFIEAPNNLDDLEIIAKKVKLPMLYNQLEGRKTPMTLSYTHLTQPTKA